MPVKKSNRLIFIFLTKFSKRDYQRFGCDIIQKRGYELEVWDCSPWFKPEYSLKYKVPDLFDFPLIKVFKTFESTKSAFSELTQKDTIIDFFNLLTALDFGKTSGAKVGRFFCGQEPTPSLEFYKISQYKLYLTTLFANFQKTYTKTKISFSKENVPDVYFHICK